MKNWSRRMMSLGPHRSSSSDAALMGKGQPYDLSATVDHLVAQVGREHLLRHLIVRRGTAVFLVEEAELLEHALRGDEGMEAQQL